ncbi:MAG: PH domain-containing protein [Chloroflexota bacterium]
MGYTDTMLAAGERLVLRQHQHWFILVGNARYAILALIGAVLLLLFRALGNGSGALWDILGWITVILFVGGLVWLGWSYLRYLNEEYIITTRRIIHAEGVINKKATDSSLEKINDLMISESLFGRMFGFGDLDVLTASETGIERLRMLHNAMDFKKALLEAKHELEIELARPTMPPLRATEPAGAPAPTPAPAPAPAPAAAPAAAMTTDQVAAALDRLADLRDRGIVTPEEFEAKKTELLERM